MYIKSEDKCGKFIEVVVCMEGALMRPMTSAPSEYGNRNTVYQRVARWGGKDICQRMFCHFAADVNMEHLIIDSADNSGASKLISGSGA